MKVAITVLLVFTSILLYRINEFNNRIDALEAALTAHREDAKAAVGKIYEDIGTLRFTQAALANTLRFVAPKEANSNLTGESHN